LPFQDSPNLGSEGVYLSDLPETDVKAEQNWFFKNGICLGGGFIQLNNVPSPKGLFLHPLGNASSFVGYDLKDSYGWFQATAAMNDTGKTGTPLTFIVWGDGRILWKSKPLHQPGQMDECGIDVSGIRRLDLQVECPGPNSWSHAVWLEPRLLKSRPKS